MQVLMSKNCIGEVWAKDTFTNILNAETKIVILPFAFSYREVRSKDMFEKKYGQKSREYTKFYNSVKEYGVVKENIHILNYFIDSNDEMKKVINESDVIVLTGKYGDKGVMRLESKELVDILSTTNKHIIGIDGGAELMTKIFYKTPKNLKLFNRFRYFKGLNLTKKDFFVDLHHKKKSKLSKKCIIRAINRKCHKVYGIGANGAVVIKSGIVRLLGDVIVYYK